jgi:hypothetical protein
MVCSFCIGTILVHHSRTATCHDHFRRSTDSGILVWKERQNTIITVYNSYAFNVTAAVKLRTIQQCFLEHISSMLAAKKNMFNEIAKLHGHAGLTGCKAKTCS